MASSTDLEGRFNRAVTTIQNLPADGIIKPSNRAKLIIYGLYKQAVLGPCKESQPYGFNYIARAKWEAWNRCRAMTREQAMLAYLNEIRKIIESMPQTNEVLEFAQSMRFSSESMEAAVNTASHAQTTVRQDDHRELIETLSSAVADSTPSSPASSCSSSSSSPLLSDMDEYYDDASDLLLPSHNEIISADHHPQQATSAARQDSFHSQNRTNVSGQRSIAGSDHLSNTIVRPHTSSSAVQRQTVSSDHRAATNRSKETQRAILIALTKLQRDIHNISQRLNQLETVTYLLQQKQLIAASQGDSISWWLPLSNFRRSAITFILLWPFVAFLLIRLLLRAKIIIRFRGEHL